MNLDSQGNIIRNPRHTVHTLDDLDISNTWFGSRNRSSSNPPEVDDAKDSLVNRPRAGTIETSSPDAPNTNTHTERKIVIINAAKKMEEKKPKDVLTIQQTKLKEPDRPKVIIQPAKPKEEEKPKVIIQQAKYKDEPKKGFINDSKPLPKQTFSRPAEPKKKIVLVENTAAEPTVKPKDVKPTRDILIIENSTTSAPAPTAAAAATTATVTASTTTPHNPDTEQSRPGYSKFAAHAAIPKAKVPRSGHSEVQIRHLYSPREDELLATRESTSVSKLRSMFGGNKS
ncbi:uncharacterized protein LOC102807230 [Saccoglossus kowalevskii]|uniref:Uncharacterized protein DDB_G0286299-like n=1 Tax=Saccoglossus kowalevskii TaxID=10224 RepID=A0ABM0MES7_SACKO|nr:PREDICTED: uncharacterized protein DDB_G0286299-like [Saccoglossus kowalevskii]